MAEQCRFGEPSKTWFRSNRFYRVNQGWYFSTREGENQGPYRSVEEAQTELSIYIRTQRLLGNAHTETNSFASQLPFSCG